MTGSTFVDGVRSEPDLAQTTGLQVTLERVSRRSDIEGVWLDLERRSDCSFFQSWGWISCWLNHLPEGLNPWVLIVSTGREVVGLGVLIGLQEVRHAFVRSNSLYLNETGNPEVDPITLEYNGFLADRRFAGTVVCRILEWLVESKDDWDELNLGGLDPDSTMTYVRAGSEIGLRAQARDKKRCNYVDLDAVRRNGGDYLGLLSRNTRYQIRRSLRLYERHGPPSVQAAQDVGEARNVLDELKRLHQAYWKGRGQPGSFASPYFEHFHNDLVASRFVTGEIQLLRLSAGSRLIGCLYNFVKDGKVYAYQSGFNYDPDPRLKPGLVGHQLAIRHNLVHGMQIYDFMAGEGQHKQSLGTHSNEMTWLVLQRPHARFRLEDALRALKGRIFSRSSTAC